MNFPLIAAVVLAAGGSSRMGRAKQLIEIEGQTLLRRTIATIDASTADLIVVTTASNGVDYNAELQGLHWVEAHVEHAQLGQSESVRAGLRLVKEHGDFNAVLFTPCDLPLLSTSLINALITEYRKGDWDVVASKYSNVLGAPLVVSHTLWPELYSLRGDVGVRKILPLHKQSTTFVPWEEGQFDLDTPDDVAAFQRQPRS